MGDRGLSAWTQVGPQRFRLVLRLLDQAAVDGCVDDMRKQGVSIVGLTPRKLTLEDAFLSLIAEPAEAVPTEEAS